MNGTSQEVVQTQKNARPSVRRELAAITEKQQAKRVALAPVKEATPLQAAPKIKTPKGR